MQGRQQGAIDVRAKRCMSSEVVLWRGPLDGDPWPVPKRSNTKPSMRSSSPAPAKKRFVVLVGEYPLEVVAELRAAP